MITALGQLKSYQEVVRKRRKNQIMIKNKKIN